MDNEQLSGSLPGLHKLLNLSIAKNGPQTIGRFAPSPSGDLHFGSLVTALAGFLIARQHHGKWLLRIDDIDQPRCKPGADDNIKRTLQAHGLSWDDDVLYQSQRLDAYDQILEWLWQNDLVYGCQCTRKQIKAKGDLYTGTCRPKNLSGEGHAVRLKNPGDTSVLRDKILGTPAIPADILNEDFVIKRRDGLHAYHLVSVIDDLAQGVTQIVRGADLLFPSACQVVLYRLFAVPLPEFLHIPLAVSEPGKKLSKQNHSPCLDNSHAGENLAAPLAFLGAKVPSELSVCPVSDILDWALEHWKWTDLGADTEKMVSQRWC